MLREICLIVLERPNDPPAPRGSTKSKVHTPPNESFPQLPRKRLKTESSRGSLMLHYACVIAVETDAGIR